MQGARDWADTPRQAIAPVTDVITWFEEDCKYSCVRYAATGTQTLHDVLRTTPPVNRIESLANAVRCLATWRNFAGSNLSPMPSEIAFASDGNPFLLAAPFRPELTAEDILACSARALFISPESLRGAAGPSDDAESLFAFVAMAALTLHRPPELPPEETLLRGANRTLLAPATLQGTLPRWMEKLDAIQEMRKEVFRLLASPASELRRVDPDDLAAQLAEWARRCNPINAIMMLRENGRLEDASNLLREMLGYEESYDLLMLGAELAVIRNSPLEGIEYLERALSLDPKRKEAFALQLRLVARNPDISRAAAGQETPELRSRLKSMLFRDFAELPAQLQQQLEHDVAQFLIRRSECDEAAAWIHPRLFDSNQVHLWWKFDTGLDYAEALLCRGALPQAEDALNGIRIGIEKANVQHSVDRDVLEEATRRRRELERLARVRRLQQAGGGSQ